MCGIAGIINPHLTQDELYRAAPLMSSSLLHRGPDGDGCLVSDNDNLLLVHRRLAIQDLSEHGKQPMWSNSQRYVIVFNGEIYNFRSLANILTKKGRHFKSNSDTEVLLAAIEEWGIYEAPNHLTGMFAYALWDLKEKALYLCRDRLGEKPLYYGWVGGGFYFASELKAIETAVDKTLLSFNREAISLYFKYGYINAPLSIYKNIFKLPPGSIIKITPDDHLMPSGFSPFPGKNISSPQLFWSLSDIVYHGSQNHIKNTDDAICQLNDLLTDTVKQQLIADVDIGTFLSGGIDSTLVTAIAHKVFNGKLKTFTIGFNESEYDESAYAEKIARHFGTDHTTLRISAEDGLALVPEMGMIYDEPFADSSQIATFLISKKASEFVTVCLSGDGGDEIFGGYNRYFWLQRAWSIIGCFPPPLRHLLGDILSYPTPESWDKLYAKLKNNVPNHRLIGTKVHKFSGIMKQSNAVDAYQYLISYWHAHEKLLPNYQFNLSDNMKTSEIASTFIENAMFYDQHTYLPGDNLTKVDRASMAVSLETRLPLLSHKLVEFSWRLPLHMKVRGNCGKWILKEILTQHLPLEFFQRPKMGFSVPIGDWLKTDLREWAESLMQWNNQSNLPYLDHQVVDLAWREHLCGRRDHANRLWSIFMFLSWAKARKESP